MSDFNKILFVTDSDNSEGPLAAALCKHWLPLQNIEVDSRGLQVAFEEPMNPKMMTIASSKGMNIEHTTKQLQNEEFGDDVLVLVLDESRKQTIYDDYSSAVNVYTVTEYINEAGSIVNPDGEDLDEYANLYATLEDITKKVAYKLREAKN